MGHKGDERTGKPGTRRKAVLSAFLEVLFSLEIKKGLGETFSPSSSI